MAFLILGKSLFPWSYLYKPNSIYYIRLFKPNLGPSNIETNWGSPIMGWKLSPNYPWVVTSYDIILIHFPIIYTWIKPKIQYFYSLSWQPNNTRRKDGLKILKVCTHTKTYFLSTLSQRRREEEE